MYVYLLQFGKHMREERFKHRDIDRFDSSVPIYMTCDYTADKGTSFNGWNQGSLFYHFMKGMGLVDEVKGQADIWTDKDRL